MRTAKPVSCSASCSAPGSRSERSPRPCRSIGAVYKSPTSGTTIRMLLDESNLGGTEIEIGEITFAPGANSGNHPHGSTEIFYVLSKESSSTS